MDDIVALEFKILNGGGKILWTFSDEEGKRKHIVLRRELFDKFLTLARLAHARMHPVASPHERSPADRDNFLGLSDEERLLR